MELEELRSISAKEELSLNFVAKDEMISKALAGLQGFDDIILKGGTALQRVYLKNNRFSEDLDFDLIFKGSVKEALAKAKEIAHKLEGFTIAKPRIMKDTIRYDLFYTNPLNHKDKIRLEFTIIKSSSGYKKRIVNFGFVPHESALLNVYDVETLIAHKIDCIKHRLEGKDFFDLYYLLDVQHKPVKGLQESKEELIKKMRLEEKQLKAMANITNHYIPRNKRPQWTLFLEELKEKVEKY